MKLANSNGQSNARKIVALKSLTNQLHTGLKPAKNIQPLDTESSGFVELSENDITRIKKEISILKTRIVSTDVTRATRKK